MKNGIALIGFMGAGKTAVGRVLAEKLGKEFVELDALIEKKTGKSISEIFEQDGEIAFRELEIGVTKEVSRRKNLVIACGGGIVLNKINIDRLKNEAVVVYLKTSPGTILKRVSDNSNERPLLKSADKATRIEELLKFRQPFYERAADITINTSRLGVAKVAERIIEKLKQNASIHI